MKKIYSVMVMCVAALTSALCVSCDRDIFPTETVLSVIDEEVTPSHSTCQITCTFHTDATIEYASVQYSTTEDFARYNVTKMIPKSDYYDGNGSYSVELTKLQPTTTYYFRYEVNACLFTSAVANKVSEFQTLQTNVPGVTTSSVEDVSHTSAAINGQITSDGGSMVTEFGIVYSISHNPTISNTKIKGTICDSTGLFTCKLSNLQNNSTYYARAYATNERGTAYGNEVSFTTWKVGEVNGHKYVDLGLSVKWATYNVGASKPEEYGDYFAWGETQPKDFYAWSEYKWCYGSRYSLIKYCDNDEYGHNGFTDHIYVLQLSDDAARANWGGSWRMPLKAELDELTSACTWTQTTQNGISGYEVTGRNGNSIFLPAAGYKSSSSLLYLDEYCCYWSSSLTPYYYTGGGAQYGNYPCEAYHFYKNSIKDDMYRCNGLSVRPVCP